MTVVGRRIKGVRRVYGTWGERKYPQCPSRADFYRCLSTELFGTADRLRREVTDRLARVSWNEVENRWMEDQPTTSAA
jgi:hypothetical protein